MSDHRGPPPPPPPSVPKFSEGRNGNSSGRNSNSLDNRNNRNDAVRREQDRTGDFRHERGHESYERDWERGYRGDHRDHRDYRDYRRERSSHSHYSNSSSSSHTSSSKWAELTPKSHQSSASTSRYKQQQQQQQRGIRVEAPRLPPRQHHHQQAISSVRSTTSTASSAYTPLRLYAARGTPAISTSDWESSATPLRGDPFDGDDDEADIERDWYDGADVGDSAMVDFTHNALQTYEMAAGNMGKRLTARQAAFARDNDRWEQNRLEMIGGHHRRRGFDASVDEDHQRSQVQLILHDCLPPFMRPGRPLAFLGSLISGPDSAGVAVAAASSAASNKAVVEPFRDVTSDMAVIARRGSPAVKAMRERRERKRLMKTLEGASTTLGHLMGKREEGDEADNVVGDHSTMLKGK